MSSHHSPGRIRRINGITSTSSSRVGGGDGVRDSISKLRRRLSSSRSLVTIGPQRKESRLREPEDPSDWLLSKIHSLSLGTPDDSVFLVPLSGGEHDLSVRGIGWIYAKLFSSSSKFAGGGQCASCWINFSSGETLLRLLLLLLLRFLFVIPEVNSFGKPLLHAFLPI